MNRRTWVAMLLTTVTGCAKASPDTTSPADQVKAWLGGLERAKVLEALAGDETFAKEVAASLKADDEFVAIAKGGKGDPGERGEKGETGDTGPAGVDGPTADEVAAKLAEDADCPRGYTRIATQDSASFAAATAGNESARLCRRGADEIVKVGDVWVDRFEDVLVTKVRFNDGGCDGPDEVDGTSQTFLAGISALQFPGNGNWTVAVYACSRPGSTPSRSLTWFQAAQACAMAGKHLVTNEEWQAAAAGTSDPGASDGAGGHCVTSGEIRKSGTGMLCSSIYGAQDMVGNVSEWTALWGQAGIGWLPAEPETLDASPWPELYENDRTSNVNGRVDSGEGVAPGMPFAALRGGSWADEESAGVFDLDAGVGPTYVSPRVGFRCARGR